MQVDGLKGSGRNRGVMKDSATQVKLMTNALVNQMVNQLVMELGVGMRKEILNALQLAVSNVFKQIFTRDIFDWMSSLYVVLNGTHTIDVLLHLHLEIFGILQGIPASS